MRDGAIAQFHHVLSWGDGELYDRIAKFLGAANIVPIEINLRL
jgi:hypothetical protein